MFWPRPGSLGYEDLERVSETRPWPRPITLDATSMIEASPRELVIVEHATGDRIVAALTVRQQF
jgi:hypothetical protein